MIGTVHEQDRTGDRRRPAGLGQEVGDRGDAGRVDLDDEMSLGAGEGGETVQEDGLPMPAGPCTHRTAEFHADAYDRRAPANAASGTVRPAQMGLCITVAGETLRNSVDLEAAEKR
jgi:hypothetical protein